MTPTIICDKDVPACVTIDATKNNKALCDARNAFSNNAGHHSNPEIAVSNLLDCLKKNLTENRVMFIGHGHEGAIIVGGGLSTNGGLYIGDNISAWQKTIERLASLRTLAEIIFCSCNTGARQCGADLVYSVAKVSCVMTYAFTGIIAITAEGEVSCQPNCKWQFGNPKASKAESPIYPAALFLRGTSMDIKLFHEDKFRTINASGISSITYYQATAEKGDQQIFALQGTDAVAIAGLIDFGAPFELKGEPLALTTGWFELQYLIDGEIRRKKFIVYNNLVVRDADYPLTFYPASPDLASVILRHLTLGS